MGSNGSIGVQNRGQKDIMNSIVCPLNPGFLGLVFSLCQPPLKGKETISQVFRLFQSCVGAEGS